MSSELKIHEESVLVDYLVLYILPNKKMNGTERRQLTFGSFVSKVTML